MLSTELNQLLLLAEPERPLLDYPAPREGLAAIRRHAETTEQRRPEGLELPVAVGDDGRVWALFSRETGLYDVLDGIREAAFPHLKLRFALARGRIDRVTEDARMVGGEVVERAEQLLAQARREGQRFVCRIEPPLLDEVLRGLLEASNRIIEEMTPYQREVWRLLREGFTQRAIADRLDKFPQSVSDAVRRSGCDAVIQTEDTLRRTLSINFERWELIETEVEAGS
jgi:hypothetical protein